VHLIFFFFFLQCDCSLALDVVTCGRACVYASCVFWLYFRVCVPTSSQSGVAKVACCV
jgi:hypothetical protein